MESFQPMVRPTLSRREQIMLTLTQKPLMEKTPSMARTVFQVQLSSDSWPTVGPIKRSSDHSLHITEASSNIIACLPFKKPKEHVEPVCWCICPNVILSGKQCRNTKFSLSIIETFFTEYYRTSYLKSACHRPTDNSVLNRLFSCDI
jgi:hypothetical protein